MKVQNGEEGCRTVVADDFTLPPWVHALPIKKESCQSHVKESGGVQPSIASQAEPQQSQV